MDMDELKFNTLLQIVIYTLDSYWFLFVLMRMEIGHGPKVNEVVLSNDGNVTNMANLMT